MNSAFENIQALINDQDSFVLEAGAGSGKTYTLIQTINDVLEKRGTNLKYNHQKMVCITYTNIAKNEIIERMENNELILAQTIHEFLWDLIKNYQKQLLIELDLLNESMAAEKPDKFIAGLITRLPHLLVQYDDSAYRDFEKGQIHHDDVITLARQVFERYPMLSQVVAEKYPVILIDEYQDTAEDTIIALIDFLLQRNKGRMVLGFFGDSHQNIYDTGIGSLDKFVASGQIKLVTKSENYRSSVAVVSLLNKIRSNITQIIPQTDPERHAGSVTFIHCNNYPLKDKKTKVSEYEAQIAPMKNENYSKVVATLEASDWNFAEGSPDKVLIIANSRVAERGGFGQLYKIYSTRYGEGATDALMKRENIFTKFFLGSMDKKSSKERKSGISHLLGYWKAKNYSEIIHFLNSYSRLKLGDQEANVGFFYLRTHQDKILINKRLVDLENLAENSTVKDVFDFCVENRLILIPSAISRFIKRINEPVTEDISPEDQERMQRDKAFFDGIMALPFRQYTNVFKHTQNHTVFSTKHGTKGDEFRNVLVVIDDTSWKQKYNFENYFTGADSVKERLPRTKNLFYVSCSRAKENLVVLALSEMSSQAMAAVTSWFGENNVLSIGDIR